MQINVTLWMCHLCRDNVFGDVLSLRRQPLCGCAIFAVTASLRMCLLCGYNVPADVPSLQICHPCGSTLRRRCLWGSTLRICCLLAKMTSLWMCLLCGNNILADVLSLQIFHPCALRLQRQRLCTMTLRMCRLYKDDVFANVPSLWEHFCCCLTIFLSSLWIVPVSDTSVHYFKSLLQWVVQVTALSLCFDLVVFAVQCCCLCGWVLVSLEYNFWSQSHILPWT
jgi:hypothetical protein